MLFSIIYVSGPKTFEYTSNPGFINKLRFLNPFVGKYDRNLPFNFVEHETRVMKFGR